MNKKTYIDSMNMLPFSDDFDEKTIEKMREAAGKAKEDRDVARQARDSRSAAFAKNGFRWRLTFLSALACVIMAASIFVLPMIIKPGSVKESVILTSATAGESETSAAAESTSAAVSVATETSRDIEAITVVDPKQYADVVTDGFLTEPGKVNFDVDVGRASRFAGHRRGARLAARRRRVARNRLTIRPPIQLRAETWKPRGSSPSRNN